jgi:hypothetical protein
MKMSKEIKILAMGILILFACIGFASASPPVLTPVIPPPYTIGSSAAGVSPTYYTGATNIKCSDIAGCSGSSIKIESADLQTPGTYSQDGVTITVYAPVNGIIHVDWTASGPVTCVILKTATLANVYNYDPAATHDEGLEVPYDPTNTNPFALSHIEYCNYIPTPEFPTIALPVGIIIGIIGLVYVSKKRES